MKTTKMVVILVLALGLTSLSLAAEDSWKEEANEGHIPFALSQSQLEAVNICLGSRKAEPIQAAIYLPIRKKPLLRNKMSISALLRKEVISLCRKAQHFLVKDFVC